MPPDTPTMTRSPRESIRYFSMVFLTLRRIMASWKTRADMIAAIHLCTTGTDQRQGRTVTSLLRFVAPLVPEGHLWKEGQELPTCPSSAGAGEQRDKRVHFADSESI